AKQPISIKRPSGPVEKPVLPPHRRSSGWVGGGDGFHDGGGGWDSGGFGCGDSGGGDSGGGCD
ncbi:hypothetical protein, partial [Nocardia cyriacigeorgica]